jgi:hypothetical protein
MANANKMIIFNLLIKNKTITKKNYKWYIICFFHLMVITGFTNCKVSQTRISYRGCPGSPYKTDSKEGYYDRNLRIDYLSKHTPAKNR